MTVDASGVGATPRVRAGDPGVNPGNQCNQCAPNRRIWTIGAGNHLAGLVGPRSSPSS